MLQLVGNSENCRLTEFFDNNVTPNFKPEKYVVSEPSFDITGNKLADDDDSADKVGIQNLFGKTLKRGQKIYYQVWALYLTSCAESTFKQLHHR